MSDVLLVGSDRCGLEDLFLDYGTEAERGRLGVGPGWHLMHRSQPGPHYTSLKAELGTIATSLARTTDACRRL